MSDEHPGISTIKKHLEAQAQEKQALDFAGQQGDEGALQVGEDQPPQQPQQPQPQQLQQGAPPQPQQPEPPPQQAPQQPSQAAQMQHPQLNQLSAPQIASNYNQDMAQSQQAYNQGIGEQEDAAKQSAAVNMQNNDATAQALAQHQELDNQYQAARNGVDEYHTSVTQQSISDMQKDIAQQEQLVNSNPHDWWGNASVPNKIGAVIGMIGAGLHGDNASEYFQRIVNNSVAESQRKQQALGHLGMARNRLNNAQQQLAENQAANLDARKAAGYGFIENQMKQRLAMTKNPQEAANLTKALGDIHEKAAKHQEEGANNMVNHNLGALKTQLEVERMSFDQQRASKADAKEKVPNDPNTYLALSAFKGRGIQSPVYKEAADKVSSSESVVSAIDKARNLLSHPSVNNAYGLKQVNAQILSELRKLQGTGANLSPEEVKNIEALTPAWGDVVRGSLSLVDFNARLTAAQRLVTNSALQYAKNVGAPENELSEKSPLYAVRHGEEQEDAASSKETSDAERARAILDKYQK